MQPKPEGCKGCGLYGDGQGFVPGVYPEGATVLVLAQNPGAEEEKAGVPLIGKTGQLLERTFLPLAGLNWAEIAKDNVLRCRYKPSKTGIKTNDIPTGKVLDTAVAQCAQYDHPLDSFRLIIATGALAATKQAGRPIKIHEWRGHLLEQEGQ